MASKTAGSQKFNPLTDKNGNAHQDESNLLDDLTYPEVGRVETRMLIQESVK
jgi:hypothetical protein